jgi:hypothetical protein
MADVPHNDIAAASASPSPSPSAGNIWDVQEILAERTTSSGDQELLVVWKTSWIPKSDMLADGPAMRLFDVSPKVIFRNSAVREMRIVLPVEPGTVLYDDCAEIGCREAILAQRQRPQPSSLIPRTWTAAANDCGEKRTLTGENTPSHPMNLLGK